MQVSFTPIMLSLLIIALCVAQIQGITRLETQSFGTTGKPEENTGFVGWVAVTSSGNKWLIQSNNIPDHNTGMFPQNGVNPNAIEEQSISYTVPKEPTFAATTTCLPGGPIGVSVNGIVMYNPWDADGENAVEGEGAEIFDLCDGHPDQLGRYHYHREPSSCLFVVVEGEPSPIIGVALDGFAIYGPVDEDGNKLTSADLDECHGRTNGNGVYQYHTTSDFPYILGCFKGTPVVNTDGNFCYKASDADENGQVGSGGGGGGPPPPPLSRSRARRSSPPAEAMIPVNLFQRRLPTRYREFLSKVIFGR